MLGTMIRLMVGTMMARNTVERQTYGEAIKSGEFDRGWEC